ncbi:uncharacterized, partial [Tachysurus ichikawai]
QRKRSDTAQGRMLKNNNERNSATSRHIVIGLIHINQCAVH